jgi:hypothetical protein
MKAAYRQAIWKKNEIVEAPLLWYMSVKSIALMLCTCTWIEIMTGVGVTLYLAYLHEYRLAALSACLFSPLIGFHFAIDRSSG